MCCRDFQRTLFLFILLLFKYSNAGNNDPESVGITKTSLNINQHIPADKHCVHTSTKNITVILLFLNIYYSLKFCCMPHATARVIAVSTLVLPPLIAPNNALFIPCQSLSLSST